MDLGERIGRKLDTTGEHHLWTGSKDGRGLGQVRVDGKLTTVRRVIWELHHGPLSPDQQVEVACREPACLRIDHLRIRLGKVPGPVAKGGQPIQRTRQRSQAGSMREIRHGVWELAVTAGRYSDGSSRRIFRTVPASSRRQASKELANFYAHAEAERAVIDKSLRKLTIDEAVELFLTEHLRDEKGREDKTVNDYRLLHGKWFSPEIGQRRVKEIDEGCIDRIFGKMRRAGLSRSRMNQAKSLYSPFFRWAKSRGIISRNPMAEFQLPTSRHVTKERTPPEVDELCLLLQEAVVVVPDIAPLLALGAVTGMRRGELVGVRRTRVFWDDNRISVDTAVPERGPVKGTKTRHDRTFHVDAETMTMLRRHCDQMDERAALFGIVVAPDGFIFSVEPDCSAPMPPDYVTKRVAMLKEHLGIANKKPETIALEDEALRLHRQPPSTRASGQTGPAPKGAFSYKDIGQRLGRSDRWALLAIRSAERREQAAQRGLHLTFDGSIVALRKFTSSELLDAGFNISMVAQRQGHGPQVLMKHYAKGRESADRKAAAHLGNAIYGARQPRKTPAK